MKIRVARSLGDVRDHIGARYGAPLAREVVMHLQVVHLLLRVGDRNAHLPLVTRGGRIAEAVNELERDRGGLACNCMRVMRVVHLGQGGQLFKGDIRLGQVDRGADQRDLKGRAADVVAVDEDLDLGDAYAF